MSNTLELLIVEDEADRRSLLSQIFTQRGFQVRAAEDGFAALRMIRSSMPDLLLSDLNMPGMSGFELLSVVRRRYPQICVIATSGAYCGPEVPAGIAADGFHEKATGMARLFELVEMGVKQTHQFFSSRRRPTPLWVDLQERPDHEPCQVLVQCSECLRPFREPVESVDARIRTVSCLYCGEQVAFAIALAILPAPATVPAMRDVPVQSLPNRPAHS